MCAEGIGPCNIAKVLQENKILKPTFYRFQKEGKYGTRTDTENPYSWTSRTIADMLDNEIYLGHTINCRTRIASFKDKRTIKVPKEEQLRFENTHEPIIDQETWDIVRKVREGRIRQTRMGEINKYSGLIYCADCGKKHYFVRGKTVKRENYNFICGNYRKHLGEEKCTPHSIREVVLDEIVLEEINKALYYARNNTKEFTDYISKKTSSQYRKELNSKTAELSKAEKRIVELKSLFKRLYEDNVLGRISDEQYRMLSVDYNDEQKELEASIPELQKEIGTLKNECYDCRISVLLSADIDHFLYSSYFFFCFGTACRSSKVFVPDCSLAVDSCTDKFTVYRRVYPFTMNVFSLKPRCEITVS